MSQTLPAGDIFVFQFPWFLKIAEDRILEGVKKDKPNIIVSDRTVEIEGQNITDFAKNIDQYIDAFDAGQTRDNPNDRPAFDIPFLTLKLALIRTGHRKLFGINAIGNQPHLRKLLTHHFRCAIGRSVIYCHNFEPNG